jgi:hypothetical protein
VIRTRQTSPEAHGQYPAQPVIQDRSWPQWRLFNPNSAVIISGEKRPGTVHRAPRVMGLDIPPYQFTTVAVAISDRFDHPARRRFQSYGKHQKSRLRRAVGTPASLKPLVKQRQFIGTQPQRARSVYGPVQSTVPGVVEWAAKHWDTDANGDPISRKPTAPLEYFKQAVPGLRQDVPRRGQSAGQGGIYVLPPPPLAAPPPPPPPPPAPPPP